MRDVPAGLWYVGTSWAHHHFLLALAIYASRLIDWYLVSRRSSSSFLLHSWRFSPPQGLLSAGFRQSKHTVKEEEKDWPGYVPPSLLLSVMRTWTERRRKCVCAPSKKTGGGWLLTHKTTSLSRYSGACFKSVIWNPRAFFFRPLRSSC